MRARDALFKCKKCGKPAQGRWCRDCYTKLPRAERLQDPTTEQLDAIIAEQLQCLPAWWDKEAENTGEK